MIGEINMAAVVGATHVVLLRTKACLQKRKRPDFHPAALTKHR